MAPQVHLMLKLAVQVVLDLVKEFLALVLVEQEILLQHHHHKEIMEDQDITYQVRL